MKILVGIDGSADALAALRFVSRLLDAQKDSVILYYSVPTSALESLRPQSTPEYATARDAFADAVFQQAKNALAPALGDTCVTIHDNEKPYKGLLKTADTHAAEMVVLGARGAGPLKRLLLGSVSHAVVHACELPTLVVRNAPSTPLEHSLRVLIACADVETARPITSLLAKLTWPAGSEARVIHVIESLFAGEIPDWVVQRARSRGVQLQAQAWVLEHEKDKQQAAEQMRQFSQTLPLGLGRAGVVVAEGNPAQQILERLEQESFELAVLGTQGLGRIMRTLLGSTSEHVLNHAPSAVLIVPHGR